MNRLLILVLMSLMLLNACTPKDDSVGVLQSSLDQIRIELVPDKRVGVFEIEATKKNGDIVLKGLTDQPDAKAKISVALSDLGIDWIDSVSQLPSANLNGSDFGVVRNSVSNLRSNPKHSAELATQALLGTPLKVLDKKGDWYRVQTPDRYIAWMDHGGFELMNQQELEAWRKLEKVIYVADYGTVYDLEGKDVISDIVQGDILAIAGLSKKKAQVVQFPDGRRGLVKSADLMRLSDWLKTPFAVDEMIADGKKWMGIPYLWGGTSVKGADCSGFTKTLFFMQGLVIPRDASQQVHEGELIGVELKLSDLAKGDLMFFGNYRDDGSERVTHVGLYIGNDQMIHATGDPGRVHISNMNPESKDYDKFNGNRFLRTKRLSPTERTSGVKTVEELY